MKCSETQLSITAEDMEICDGTTNISNGPQQNTRSTSHSSTNGSIITMTLKNNHLIVETEERNVRIERFCFLSYNLHEYNLNNRI